MRFFPRSSLLHCLLVLFSCISASNRKAYKSLIGANQKTWTHAVIPKSALSKAISSGNRTEIENESLKLYARVLFHLMLPTIISYVSVYLSTPKDEIWGEKCECLPTIVDLKKHFIESHLPAAIYRSYTCFFASLNILYTVFNESLLRSNLAGKEFIDLMSEKTDLTPALLLLNMYPELMLSPINALIYSAIVTVYCAYMQRR